MKTKILAILGSPRFWALIVTIAILAVMVFVGGPLNQTEVITATVALVGFIVATAATGSPTDWAKLLGDFKFWSLLVSLVFVFVRAYVPSFPLTADTVLILVGALTGASISFAYRPINTTVSPPPQS